MLDISVNNMISLTRGDTFQDSLFLNEGTPLKPIRYILQEGDQVFLGVTEPNQPFEKALIKKKFTNANLNEDGDVIITFEHTDTACLLPGKYFYEIKLVRTVNNQTLVDSVIPKTQFNILE